MTRQDAYAMIEGLSTAEKILLYEMLLDLKQNPEPAELPKGTDQPTD